MVDHRRMGNVEQQLGNATSATISHQLRDLWKSPRGTVIRIEVLALVAILLSFILAAFGSCRRWSNRWIIQKGFFAANALSLSLGTYSIGLMQSSSVKSEMYPIWAVSLLTLFGSVDSITSYNGLDYKSPLFKALFQLCLYCGYVLLISISTMSSDVGKIAIGVLCAITFVKGFHRSLAFVLPSRLRNILRIVPTKRFFTEYVDYTQEGLSRAKNLIVELPEDEVDIYGLPLMRYGDDESDVDGVPIGIIWQYKGEELESDLNACKGVCLPLALSHLLQRHIFGLNRVEQSYCTNDVGGSNLKWLLVERDGIFGYDWAFKLIEVELAFIYDVFFTSNAFLHYYQAKAATIWTSVSAMGICFVGVVAAVPGMRRSSGRASLDTVVVDSTAADVAITLVVLVSLVLLQVLQALRCWTSNWARVGLALDFVYNRGRLSVGRSIVDRQMRLKAFFTRINWFDNKLWQEKLGQYSVVESTSMRRGTNVPWAIVRMFLFHTNLPRTLGIQYIQKALSELLWGSSSTTVGAVGLHPDVKASVAHALGEIEHGRRGPMSPLLSARGLDLLLLSSVGEESGHSVSRDDPSFIGTGMYYQVYIWAFHVATCYCDLAHLKSGCGNGRGTLFLDDGIAKKNHRVATTLSKYCAYLSVSAPQLLPGDDRQAKYVHGRVMLGARNALRGATDRFEAMEKGEAQSNSVGYFWAGVNLGKRLHEMEAPERWSLLADFWVRALLEAAPSDNVDEHIRHLSQGGEFITHLWAFLYHAGIVKWQLHQEGAREVTDSE